MDTHFLSQLVFSILILAPGVVLLAGLAFLGLLMLLEKALFGRDSNVTLVTAQAAVDLAAGSNPAPGRIVHALKASMNQPVANTQRKANR